MAELPAATDPRRKTIRDVAALAGVDPSLVSRVLNDSRQASASPATRARIHEAARTLGYQPNVAARGLRTGRTWTLGLLLPNLSNPIYSTIARAAELRARERGFGLIFGTHTEGEDDATFARGLQQARVDGLLAASGLLGDRVMRAFASAGQRPVVMLNRRVRRGGPSVTVDDAAGAALATEYLAASGHKDVAGIFGAPGIETTRRRRAGFLEAANRAGVRPVLFEAGGLDAAAGRDAAAEIMRRHPAVTAIFASTFAIGMGALRAARDMGVPVPEAMSLIALHDSDLADYLSPPLTTVALPVAAMAERAVDVLIGLIDGADPRSVVVKTAPILKVRESVGKPRAESL